MTARRDTVEVNQSVGGDGGMGDPDEVTLPAADDLPGVLIDLAVPHEDIGPLVANLTRIERDPGALRVIGEYQRVLTGAMGAVTRPGFPDPPADLGPYFPVFVYLAALPRVRAFHRSLGVPEPITRATLADLGRNMAVHRRRYGAGGLAAPYWLMGHVTAALYQLGRLQFQRDPLGGRTGRAVAAAGLPYGPGDPVLSVHVPDFLGPLTPAAVDRSFARARGFFDRYFPAERHDLAVCHSWLLDERLAEYLPVDSNIVGFAQRFTPAYRPDPDDDTTVLFVYGLTSYRAADLPRRTTLERAVADHLRAGRHWHGGAGWTRLPAPALAESGDPS